MKQPFLPLSVRETIRMALECGQDSESAHDQIMLAKNWIERDAAMIEALSPQEYADLFARAEL